MQTIELNGAWQVGKTGDSETIPARVPGCVHLDLLAAKRIEDPFFRDNEDRLQWIGETEWRYARRFTVGKDVLAHDKVLLVCAGLDTLATVSLNGKIVGKTDNMFRSWEFDATPFLHAGENSIEVHFASPLPIMRRKDAERYLHSWGGPKEKKGRSYIRKEPCNFGWDWGPALVTCGIWRDISIVAFNTARLSDAAIQQDHSKPNHVTLSIDAAAEIVSAPPGAAAPLAVSITVSHAGKVVAQQPKVSLTDARAHVQLPIADPKLWWPSGMGAQPLYELKIELLDGTGKVLDTNTKRIGLRTLRLDRHPDQWGESFQFTANGIPFFTKGANWIPADTFVNRLTRDDYRRLIQDAVDANMNMLRLWGGGIYEQADFYELCDELGICIWHDFMFACAAYPTFDDAFMENVRVEAEQNIRRVRHHASIALWCGNNELEQGLVGDGWTDKHMSWEDYAKLFDQMLPDLIKQLDPQRDYWPCSPHTPVGNRVEHWNPNSGDAHLWEVWHGRKPFEWYRTCTHRFNSEFGFQSFPEPKTVNGYTAPQDRNVTTYVMEHHQRSGIGNAVIMQYMLDWFRLPTAFDMQLRLSQILQGMAMKYAVEHWRRQMPRGMGTLYWQLNDCWPVASWSSIDYHGRWKALHYMAKDFYAPLLVSGVEDVENGTVAVHVTSDLLKPVSRARLTWHLTDVHGAVLKSDALHVDIAARADQFVTTLDVKSFLQQHSPRNLLLWLELEVEGKPVSSNLVLFCRPKHLELESPQIRTTVKQQGADSFAITLESAKPALWTWLELADADATFSENYVHLRPGHPVELEVKPWTKLSVDDVKRQLRLASLIDTYA